MSSMETEKVIEKITRWILLSKEFEKENISVYVKDDEDNLFFGKIISIDESKIILKCFAPEHRKGNVEKIRWLKIIKFSEYVGK